MARNRKSSSQPRAVSDLRALRDRMAEEVPELDEAARLETEAEGFCKAVRIQLRDRRKAEGLDQTELGEIMNLTQSAISRIEKGTGDIGLKTLYRYARALNYQPILMLALSVENIFEQVAHRQGKTAVANADIQRFAAEFNDEQTRMMSALSDEMHELLTRAVDIAGHVHDP